MNNGNLQNDLEKISSYDDIRCSIGTEFMDSEYRLEINDSSYLYYCIEDIVLDCIELSKFFELKFV